MQAYKKDRRESRVKEKWIIKSLKKEKHLQLLKHPVEKYI